MGSDGGRRPMCAACLKPSRLCICSRLRSPPIDNAVGVTVLQHSAEARHPLNSTRVARLGLANLSVVPVSDVLLAAKFIVRPLGDHGSSAVAQVRVKGEGGVEFGANGEEHSISKSSGDGVDPSIGEDGELSDPQPQFVSNEDFSRLNKIISHPSTEESEDEHCSRPDAALDLENTRDCIASDIDLINLECSRAASASESEANSDTGSFFSDMQQQYELNIADKCKVAYSDNEIRIMIQSGVKPKLNWLLRTRVAQTAISVGFTVRKVQVKQCRFSGKIQEVEEYNIVLPPRSGLLYPAQRSVGLETYTGKIEHLVVLDGTWGKAQRMYHESPWLRLLPHLKLDSKSQSLYHEVRHEPKIGFLSTVESIVCAMKKLGDDREELDHILDVFKSMINDQRRCKEERHSRTLQS